MRKNQGPLGLMPCALIFLLAIGLLLPMPVQAAAEGDRYFNTGAAFILGEAEEKTGQLSAKVENISVSLQKPKIDSRYPGEGYTQFSWDMVDGAVGYEIWRRKSGKWKYVCRLEGSHVISYSDREAEPCKKNYYRVRAYDKNGCFSAFSIVCSVYCKLGRPVICKLTRKSLEWSPVRRASKYCIYRRVRGKWKKIGSTKKRHFKIPKKYRSDSACFMVKAWYKGNYSGYDDGFSRKNMKYHSMKVLLEGDSIVYYKGSWMRRTARLLNFDWDCRAVNASKISNSAKKAEHRICQRSLERGFKGYDLIIIAAGTNDYNGNVELGTPDSTDNMTFYGAYQAILKKARSDAPNATIVLCTPTERRKMSGTRDVYGYQTPNKAGYTLEDYRKAILRLARKYNCKLFDAKTAGIITQRNIAKNTFDLLHPNDKANIAMSKIFLRYLKKKVL